MTRSVWLFKTMLLCMALMGMGCQPKQSGPPPMTFAVENDRLGEVQRLDEAGVQFQAPRDWETLSVGQVDTVAHALDVEAGSLAMQPYRVFLDPTTQSVLSVARLELDSQGSFAEDMTTYGHILQERFAEDSLRQTLFVKDGITMAQFLVQPDGLVNFKLVMATDASHMLQFDYLVPRSIYPQEIKNIESSIGSIQHLP